MLIFGHTGVTLGAAALLSGALKIRHFSQGTPTSNHSPGSKASRITALGSYIDIRLLLFGSLLPDIIDKPVGHFIFAGIFGNGRLFAHTLIFFLLIIVAGIYLYRYRREKWLLTISFGIFTHLIFDKMWGSPQTLFWPFYGFAFERVELVDWVPIVFHGLFTNPEVYIPELAGMVILVWFGLVLVRRRKVCAFIKYGQVR